MTTTRLIALISALRVLVLAAYVPITRKGAQALGAAPVATATASSETAAAPFDP